MPGAFSLLFRRGGDADEKVERVIGRLHLGNGQRQGTVIGFGEVECGISV